MELQLPPGAMVEAAEMNVMGVGMVGELCGALADCIDEDPKGASRVARKLSSVLLQQVIRAERREVEERNEQFQRLKLQIDLANADRR